MHAFSSRLHLRMVDATITMYGEPPKEPTHVTLPRLFREYRLFTYCDCRDAFSLYKTCHAVNRNLRGEWERQRLQVWQKATSVFWQCSPTVRATYLDMPYDELRMHIELWTAHGRDIPAEIAPAILTMMGQAAAPPAFVGQCTARPRPQTHAWVAALDTSRRCFAHKQLKSEADQLAQKLLQEAATTPVTVVAATHPPYKARPTAPLGSRGTPAASSSLWAGAGDLTGPPPKCPTRPAWPTLTQDDQPVDTPEMLAAKAWARATANVQPEDLTSAVDLHKSAAASSDLVSVIAWAAVPIDGGTLNPVPLAHTQTNNCGVATGGTGDGGAVDAVFTDMAHH